MQSDLSLDGRNVAVVSLEKDGGVTIREAVHLNGDRELHKAFWKTLAGALFSVCSNAESEDAAGLSAIGIEDTFTAALIKAVKPDTSAILILADNPVVRDSVIGLLHGFRAKIIRSRLVGENRVEWLARLAEAAAD
jgi:uncharacterized membrane protein